MSHKSVGAWTLIINGWKRSRQQSHWKSVLEPIYGLPSMFSHQNLGQQSLTWCLKFAYQTTSPPPPSPLPPPPSFLFLYVWTGWVPGSQPLLLLVVPHFLTRIRPPPPPPNTPPASFHHAREGKQSWHVSLMRSRAQSVGKELHFPSVGKELRY